MSPARQPLALRPNPALTHVSSAMVMAAGLGKRMRPLTATRPKPLIKVAGKMLIDHSFDRLRAANIHRAVVNVHYLADAVEAHLRLRQRDFDLIISDERDHLLETGGGLVKAGSLIDDDQFLVVNSDCLWIDGPVDAICLLDQRWDPERMDALLLMVPLARAWCHSGSGDFHMDADGLLRRRQSGRVAPFVYSGVQIVSRRLLRDPPEGAFSTNLLWNRAIEEGRCFGFVHEGLWFDVGTPQAIARTEKILRHG